MRGSVRLCLSGKLPKEGRFRSMRAGRRRFCVAQQDGQFLVMDSLCPHKELPLGKGSLAEGNITCPWHGWCFDPQTGQPQSPSGQPQKSRPSLETYPAALQNDELFVILA